MPGQKSYGPAGKWVHDRAKRIMSEGDTKKGYGKKDGKSIAYAIAVQQAHKMGKSPKKFRTPEGMRVAKQKFDLPKKEYRKTAAIAGFFDEMDKIANRRRIVSMLNAERKLAGGTLTPRVQELTS
jgi:hypothetical protein